MGKVVYYSKTMLQIRLNNITTVKYIRDLQTGNIKRFVNEYEFGWTTSLEYAFVKAIFDIMDKQKLQLTRLIRKDTKLLKFHDTIDIFLGKLSYADRECLKASIKEVIKI